MFDTAAVEPLVRGRPHLVHGLTVKGPRLTFREASPSDAEFVYSLRTDRTLNEHISAVPEGVEHQAEFIANACTDVRQLYFIIEAEGPVGTVRLYDVDGNSFRWGSWILRDAPIRAAADSTAMVYALGLELGFTEGRLEVRKPNERVWRFQELWGAKRTHEDELHYWYSIDEQAMRACAGRFKIAVN